jgi:hypothetical protein
MKRSAMGHTKLKKLARKLNIPIYAAVGLLECLWHLTAREAPRGDIGRLCDEDICVGLDWDGDEAALIAALVEARWLDRSDVHRLIVHDWHDHADDATKKLVSRNGWTFSSLPQEASQDLPDGKEHEETVLDKSRATVEVSGNVATCRDVSRLPEPEPEPEPESSLSASAPAPAEARAAPSARQVKEAVEAQWREFETAYPKRGGDRKAAKGREKFLQLVKNGEDPDRIVEGARRYAAWCDATGKTKSEFVQQMPTWLGNRGWEEDWEPPEFSVVRGGTVGSGSLESREARRSRLMGVSP